MGPESRALTLSRYAHLEAIPKDWQAWHPSIRKARTLAATLFDAWNDVLLYRTLATLRLDVRTFDTVDGLRWTGPCTDFEDCCSRLQSRTSSSAQRLAYIGSLDSAKMDSTCATLTKAPGQRRTETPSCVLPTIAQHQRSLATN